MLGWSKIRFYFCVTDISVTKEQTNVFKQIPINVINVKYEQPN